MKKLILLIIVSQSLHFYAQKIDTTRITLSKIEYEKLKTDFLKVSKTKLFKKCEKAREVYLRNVFACSNKETEIGFKNCLYEKLGNEGAKKVIRLGKKRANLEKRLSRKYPEMYALLKKTTIEQKIELRKISTAYNSR